MHFISLILSRPFLYVADAVLKYQFCQINGLKLLNFSTKSFLNFILSFFIVDERSKILFLFLPSYVFYTSIQNMKKNSAYFNRLIKFLFCVVFLYVLFSFNNVVPTWNSSQFVCIWCVMCTMYTLFSKLFKYFTFGWLHSKINWSFIETLALLYNLIIFFQG